MIDKAKKLAQAAHVGQRRKYTFEPYWAHPEEVAALVATVTDDSEMIAAAWLHDTVEDTHFTTFFVEVKMGARVAMLVDQLTNVSIKNNGSREEQKRIDRERLSKVSPEAQTIKLADMICNMRSIIENDPSFAKVYVAEKDALLRVLTKGHPLLYDVAENIIDSYYENEDSSD